MTKDEAVELCHILEQQPCEDAISRQAVKEIDFDRICVTAAKPAEMIRQKIDALPPVQPKIKTGHWIDIKYYHYYNDGDIETTELRCSCCNEIVEWDIESPHKPYYCENCGAKMIKPQESEVTE